MASKIKQRPGSAVRIAILAAIGFVLLIKVLLHGRNIAVLNPQGLMAHEQLSLLLFAAILPLTIAVPTVAFLYYTAWKYRETNPKAKYEPEKKHGRLFNAAVWIVPAIFMMTLSAVMWSETHRLEPQKAIASNVKPLTVQVVALRWKWLFIYPEQKIATVNFVQIPADTPVRFELTADDTPMSAFWVPNLGGMLYAMTGHVNPLNLMGHTVGDFPGSVAEINGAGFAGMKFTTRVSTKEDFDTFVRNTQWSQATLTATEYDKLLKPSESNPAAYYADVDTGLYDKVLMKYMGSHAHHEEKAY